MMNKHCLYPAYKPSGVPWLGDLPEHWDVIPTRALLNLKKQLVGDRADKYTLLSLTKQGIIARDMENPEGKFPASFETYQVVEPGDLVFCLFDIDETPRTIGLSSMTGMITGAYTRFVCPNEQTRRFIYQLYLSLDNGKLLKPLYSGLRKVITKSTFLSATIPLPPLPEQAAIVRYLDYVDRRIRRYVTAKRKLIALLEEERQAVVNRAVTRGLNPNVRLKPSGVEWLGDVPAHWEVLPNKGVLELKKETVGDKADKYTLLSLTKQGIIPRNLEVAKGKYPASFDTYQVVVPGDLIFCLFDIDETPRTVGISTEEGMVTGAYTRFVCVDETTARFAYLLYLSLDDRKALRPLYSGLRKAIATQTFLGAKLALPPANERATIIEHVEKAIADIEAAIARARRQIELLQEYRTRLIADVVTGKLDVREAAAQLPDEPDDEEPIDEGRALADDADGDLYDAGNFKAELAMESEVRA